MTTQKNNFSFLGKAPLSKSLLNRAFIVQSWFPDFLIKGDSQCEDIIVMKKALQSFLENKTEFYCGLSATALRFLAVRLSREKGEFLLTGDKALFKRPLAEVTQLLSQLSVYSENTKKGFRISTEGWKFQGDCIHVPSQISSQYASALILNSWNLEQDLHFSLEKDSVSFPYFKMTINFLKTLGFTIQGYKREFYIPKKQNLKIKHYNIEQDKSCLFALACFATLNGQAVFLDWKENSLQPDHIFPDILQKMGTQIEKKEGNLIISKNNNLKPLNFDLKGIPDLFPLLSVLCAKAEGRSELLGLSHLAFKESNRLTKTAELLKHCGIKMDIQKDRCVIQGQKNWSQITPFEFDTAKDHRMLMAGELVASLGVPITIHGKDSINKSFPEFYSFIG